MDAGFTMPQKIPEEHFNKITEALQSVNCKTTTHELIAVLEVFRQLKMDIAVTGESGSGKSTLINALRGLNHGDEGAASTGVVETTTEPSMYQYPNLPYCQSTAHRNMTCRSLRTHWRMKLQNSKERFSPIFMANLFTRSRTKAKTFRHHALQSGKIGDEDLAKLCTICKRSDFTHGAEEVKIVLEALDHFQLDVAILGETGSGVSTLLNALCGQRNITCSSTPATGLRYPDVRFWAVSGIERITDDSFENLKQFMDKFDYYVIIVSDWQKALHIELARAASQLRKHYQFVQTKVDCHLQAQSDLCYSETDLLDGLRAQCAEELKKANHDHSQLFLINSLDRNAFDFVSLESVLSSDLTTIRSSAFAYWVDGMVRQKQKHSTCQIL
ncbi:interferon-gamma-inducible GTPase 10 [Brachyhypopomus gauderio]|uniref:interferon-gamma-inducible GTPase 10 n=1 Tax=Brachyhypopomus gauderio TaxID=698409 RepID=UPI004041A49B